MKSVFNSVLLFIIFSSCFCSHYLNAQSINHSSWSKKFGYQNVFIENKGQFLIPNDFGNSSEILFAVDQGGTKIYFTKKGITYTFLETTKKQKDDREMERERREEFKNTEDHARQEKEEHALKVKADQVTMLWLNANQNTVIEASDLTSDYYTYQVKQSTGDYKNFSFIKSYKKIKYKNIYPNIDIEYIFSEKGGLKYSLILHPQANPSLVKMIYDKHVSLNSKGEIKIHTKFGDIIDHAPLSFYMNNTGKIINSSFLKSGKVISFYLDHYDSTKSVVIDPWTQTPTFTSNWDCVWECEKDLAGNVYIIGGVTPMQLLKYNAAGALQWTYNTPYDTTAWLGTFAVDNAGNSYVTQGSAAQMVKVSTAGAVLWNNTSPGGLFSSTEFWNITFNCDQTRLVIGGTGGTLPPLPYVYEMNMTNGNITSSIKVTNGSLIPTQEVRSIAPCGNGRYYFLTHDSIGYLNQTFNACSNPNAALYKTSNSYSLGYKCENFRYDNSGIMAIKANTSFVYTHRGNQLDKRSLATGAIISSVAIPGGGWTSGFGGNSVQNSGIDIDNCGNVYVGSKNSVIKFDGNLTQLASYPTTYNVYDVHITIGGNIIACGSSGTSSSASRTGTIEYINAGACTTISLTCCDVNICQPANICSTAAAFNLQAATAGGTWSGVGITNTTNGTFNPSVAGIGPHVITYSLACGVGSVTVNVLSCGTVTLCINSGSLTANGGSGTYTWASTSTSVSCANCPGGTCIPFVCAGTSVPTWTASGTTVTAPAVGIFPIKVTDTGTGTTFTFTTLASIPACSTPTCPTILLSVTSQTNVNCFGATTGTASVSGSGGIGPYSYTWTPGNLSGASQTLLVAGVYTVNVKDANNCIGSGTLSITQPTAALSAIISSTTSTGCGSSTGGATVTANGGTPTYTYSWSPSGGTTLGVSNLGAGSNSVLVTDSKGCTVAAVANITTSGGPTLSVVSQTNVNCFGATTGSATVLGSGGTGPYSYTWTPGNLIGASQTALGAGVYTVNVKDANNCVSSGTISITQPTAALSAIISNSVLPACGLSNGSATVIATGGTPSYSYSWSPNGGTGNIVSNLSSGSNSVIVIDSKGCTSLVVLSLSSVGGPSLTILSQTTAACFGTNTGSANVTGTGGVGPYTYTWTPGNLSGANQTALAAGIYTVNVKDANQCIGTGTVFISQPTALSGNISNTPTGCGTSVGSATLISTGGTPSYSYNWIPSGGTNATAFNLSAGTYSVLVTDSRGCQVTLSTTVNSIGGGPILSIVSQSNVICNGGINGNASVSVTSGSGAYTYTWLPAGGNTSSASGLSAGIYTVIVRDGVSCISSITISISQPPAIVLAVTSTPATCGSNDGSANVSVTGGTAGYTTVWNNSSNTNTINGLSSGTYSVFVTDANGCSASGSTVVGSVGTLTVDAGTGGTIHQGQSIGLSVNTPSNSSVSWSPSGSLSCSSCSNTNASPLQTTTYTITVFSNGCAGYDTVTVFVDILCGELFVPSAFSPNDDGENDVLYVMGNCIKDLEFVIFDRWGEKVFESNDPTFGWDGTFNGKKMTPAAFAYYIKALINGEKVIKKGSVSILK